MTRIREVKGDNPVPHWRYHVDNTITGLAENNQYLEKVRPWMCMHTGPASGDPTRLHKAEHNRRLATDIGSHRPSSTRAARTPEGDHSFAWRVLVPVRACLALMRGCCMQGSFARAL